MKGRSENDIKNRFNSKKRLKGYINQNSYSNSSTSGGSSNKKKRNDDDEDDDSIIIFTTKKQSRSVYIPSPTYDSDSEDEEINKFKSNYLSYQKISNLSNQKESPNNQKESPNTKLISSSRSNDKNEFSTCSGASSLTNSRNGSPIHEFAINFDNYNDNSSLLSLTSLPSFPSLTSLSFSKVYEETDILSF